MLNFNVGILGHVDSGKTSLAKALSEVASTAAFDKNPQSKARGITLDLGFSSFCIATPEHIQNELSSMEKMQLTLVDCPGHASLIRTIIGGAQIIDLILLVVDVTKGIQMQTAECLVIGEITCKNMIVVFNKIDLIEEDKRNRQIEKMEKRLRHVLSTSCFIHVPIVNVAADPKDKESIGIDDLIAQISKSAFIPVRNKDAPFLFAVDHCFGIKGKGTVITGTVLQGNINIEDVIDLPAINITRKVKSMQMFKKTVSSASAGDRLGICVTQFDPKLMERGIACSPGLTKLIYCAILPVNKIKYFKGHINTKSKFHITIGHETTMATITCFNGVENLGKIIGLDFSIDYQYSEELNKDDTKNIQEYLLLEFEKPVLAVDNCMIIGSKLDMDMHGNDCRIAFWGNLITSCKEREYKSSYLPKLKIYKNKHKSGMVERLVNDNSVIVRNMFKKETTLEMFAGLKVYFSTGEEGIIEGSFGLSGKVKIYVSEGLNPNTISLLKNKNKAIDGEMENKAVTVTLSFKKYIYDSSKRILQ